MDDSLPHLNLFLGSLRTEKTNEKRDEWKGKRQRTLKRSIFISMYWTDVVLFLYSDQSVSKSHLH